jgi:hypothetical protein
MLQATPENVMMPGISQLSGTVLNEMKLPASTNSLYWKGVIVGLHRYHLSYQEKEVLKKYYLSLK